MSITIIIGDTLKSYKDALTLYVVFLEVNGIMPNNLDKSYFGNGWITWLKAERKCCLACNVRLASLRLFLEY
ncbi:hypothetical protein GCM10023142_17830 [Anaerocolumna aminovalerica]